MTEGSGRGDRGARTGSSRLPVTLACSECKARNYKTTKGADRDTALELKKYCKVCKRHTLHRETK